MNYSFHAMSKMQSKYTRATKNTNLTVPDAGPVTAGTVSIRRQKTTKGEKVRVERRRQDRRRLPCRTAAALPAEPSQRSVDQCSVGFSIPYAARGNAGCCRPEMRNDWCAPHRPRRVPCRHASSSAHAGGGPAVSPAASTTAPAPSIPCRVALCALSLNGFTRDDGALLLGHGRRLGQPQKN